MVGQLVEAARDRLAVPALSQGAAGYLLAQAEQVLGDLAEAFAAGAAASPTVRQVAAELVFGFGDDAHLPPLKLPLVKGGRLVLRGKIDRVDLAADGQLFVIDYKTHRMAVDWPGLFHGLSLQLPAYLLAIAQHADRLSSILAPDRSPDAASDIRPGGAFFQQIIPTLPNEDPPPSDAAPPSERDRLVGFRRQGFFVDSAGRLLDVALEPGEASPFVKLRLKKDATPAASGCDAISDGQLAGLLELTRQWLCRLGGEILAGQIAVSPYQLKQRSPCGMCDFRSVCRLDFAYNRPRQLASINRKQILAKLAEEKGAEGM
jgi:ATP-dependent helicase/nuclease subunit B